MESLQYLKEFLKNLKQLSFKPYYKWNTFNTISPSKFRQVWNEF